MQITIDQEGEVTLQSQIVQQICSLIERGVLPYGSAVPASRQLSKQLEVSRNTVTAAYDSLINLGYLYTENGVGTFVCKEPPERQLQLDPSIVERQTSGLYQALNLPLPYTGRGFPGLHKPTPRDVLTDFVAGRSEAEAFPEKAWRRIINSDVGRFAKGMCEYNNPAGLSELRQLIASMLGPMRSMVVSREQVLMVAGFQQGINLAAHLFVSNGTRVAMEAPGYRGAAFLFESYGGEVLPIPLDEQGIVVDRLPKKHVKFVYVTPSNQFPTGVVMSLSRRLALLKWAADTGAYIIEVDYDADYYYEGSPLPSIQSLDDNGCVIYINSFTRSIGPGLRLGYVVVPRDLIGSACRVKSLMDNGLPWLDQSVLSQFIRAGGFENHLKRLCHCHTLRRDVLLATIRDCLQDSTISGAHAGSHLMLTLPSDTITAKQAQEFCAPLGVGVHPLADTPAWFYEQLAEHQRVLLLGYSHLSEDQIRHGIRTLASTLLLNVDS